MLLNLLSNAFKFTPDGGSIVLRAETATREELPEKARSDAGLYPDAALYLRLTLADNGVGMDTRDLERIFDPFYQAQNPDIKSVGTGIGLSLAKGIVEMHHGVIYAESEKGRGSTFHVIVPCGNAHFHAGEIISDYLDSETLERYTDNIAADETPETPELPAARSEATVLVVEDNRQLRTYIRRRLSPYWKVIEADNGKSGQLLALEKMPALIISDIMMPVMDGLTALKILRSKGDVTPVILLTAKSEIDDRISGLDSGADDYLTKPFSVGELLARIRSLTRRGQDMSPSKLNVGSTSLDSEEQELSCHNSIRLSGKETKLMKLLMLNPLKGLDTKFIFDKIWSKEEDVDESVVWIYISYLRGKLLAVMSDLQIDGEEGGSFTLMPRRD